jgi:hypothetical protein
MVRARGGSWPAASNPHRPDHARNPAHAKAPGLDTPGGGRRSVRTRRARLRHSLKPNHGGSRPSARAAASLLRKDPQGEVAPGGVTVQPLGGCASISPGPLSPDYFGSHIYPPTPVERRLGLQTFRSVIVILGGPVCMGPKAVSQNPHTNWAKSCDRFFLPVGLGRFQKRLSTGSNFCSRPRPAVYWLELLLSPPPSCLLARSNFVFLSRRVPPLSTGSSFVFFLPGASAPRLRGTDPAHHSHPYIYRPPPSW